jgi:predicted NAD-dependent protein-ADP-ribosyltransferase YbiA (DUF1768 family)
MHFHIIRKPSNCRIFGNDFINFRSKMWDALKIECIMSTKLQKLVLEGKINLITSSHLDQ